MKGMILQGSTIFLSNREARCESFAMQPSVFPANWGEQAIISLEGGGGVQGALCWNFLPSLVQVVVMQTVFEPHILMGIFGFGARYLAC